MDNYIGKMLDNRYEIIEIIGVGGMAVVYKAKCNRLNRPVALKILKSEYARNDDFRKRFHAESQAVAMLSHPNIVAVYDVSRSQDTEYIVMELIDGITLKQYIQKKGVLNWREALHFATQIAKALSHAHGRGIIHRDIKPHNIMVLRDGSVKVADFGIARFASKQNTLTQEALGSVHYISPEQARGSHIDARSDIYSVGVVMYEMMTNRLPYEGDTPVSVAIQHINSIPLTPREIDPNIPEPLEAITMKAMSPSLGKRYASAEMLLHDLEEFRKNPKISFDYNIEELTARDEIDEPTRNFTNGTAAASGAAASAGASVKRPRDMREDSAYAARQRNKSLSMISGVLCILIFVAGMFYLALSLPGWRGPEGISRAPDTESIQVPYLIGKDWTKDVQNSSMYADWLIQPKSDGEYHDYYEEGVIVRQDPAFGDYVKKDRNVITVTLSKGRETMSMPDVYKREYRDAENFLREIGFSCIIAHEYDDTLVKDFVIRTDPPASVSVQRGSVVTVYVSRGPQVERVAMPHLVDKTVSEAERLLEQADLLWLPHIRLESDKPEGTVLSQDIASSIEIEVKTEVQLEISLGPPEIEDPVTPPPDPVTPPPDPVTPPPDPVTPPPDPVTPPPDPVTPTPPDRITGVVTVALPSEPGTVNVKYVLNDIVYDSQNVNTSDGVYSKSVTGTPDDILMIFFDDTLQTVGPLSDYISQ